MIPGSYLIADPATAGDAIDTLKERAMAIPTRPGVVGFFMSDPELTESDSGRKRLFAWAGFQDPTPNEDGTYPEPVRRPLIMFNASAERAAATFRNGDNFLATGRLDVAEHNGEQRERFIASSIGPDNNLSTIHIQRGRTEQRTAEQATPERDAEEIDPAAAALAQREQALALETTSGPEPSSTATVRAGAAAVAR